MRSNNQTATKTLKLADLKLDGHNANRGTVRGRKLLAKSLQRYGAGRSILLDKKGRVIAGNKTVEQAIAAGHKQVLIVPSDGTNLVAVQRTDLDLTDSKAKALAVADNRVAELDLEWNSAELEQISADADISDFFTAGELEGLLEDVAKLATKKCPMRDKTWVRVLISVPIESAAQAKDVLDKLSAIDGIEIDYSGN
jgi:hypothetical protein